MALRASKFDLNTCMQRIERFYLLKNNYFDYVDMREESVKRSMMLLNDGVVLPLKLKDNEGRTIIIVSLGKRDTKSFTSAEMIRLLIMAAAAHVEEETAQLAGFVYIIDCTGIEFRQCLSYYDLKFLSEVSQKAAMMRVKKIILFNLPAIASASFKIAESFFSKKMSERILNIDNAHELADHIKPQTILPECLGGEQRIESLISSAKEMMNSDKSKWVFEQIEGTQIDLKNIPKTRWFGWLNFGHTKSPQKLCV